MNHLFRLAITAVMVFSFESFAKAGPMIVGGDEAAPNEFPYIVSLHERWGHVCGGSLIKKNWVLTAGHCLSGTRITKIYIGLHDQRNKTGAEAISPKRIIRHPQYNNGTIDYDFGLIELAEDSTFTPVEFNREEIAISEDSSMQIMATTAGWGEMNQTGVLASATKLQRVDVPLVNQATCNTAYSNAITDRMICAGYPEGKKDACFGDSGGPLVVDVDGQHVLTGVVSWGDGCARAGKYGVYAKVNAIQEWIDQTTAN